jgi:hypothetical protein
MAEFERATGISKRVVYRLFPGGWAEVLAEAGRIEGTRVVGAKEVVERLARLEQELGRGVTWNELMKKRPGEEPGHPAPSQTGASEESGGGAEATGTEGTCVDVAPPPASPTAHPPAAGEEAAPGFGRPIGARVMVCEPVNEMGVVLLFGDVGKELGYRVLGAQGGFPDCEALRRGPSGRWEQVRIEFEFKSGNFAKHGHDARGCDVIVCWENDWPGCPLEVVELKKHVAA